jgi:hypothetical protein
MDHNNLYTSSFVGGICKNGKQLGWGQGSQPHSVMINKGQVYYCASNKGEVWRGSKKFCTPGGFTRGLCAVDKGLLVGSSADRHGAGGKNARLEMYDWSGKLQWTVQLPTNEVYSITTTDLGANS